MKTNIHPLNNSNIVLVLLIIPFFRPGIISRLPGITFMGFDISLHNLFNIWELSAAFFIFMLFIFSGKLTRLTIAVLIYFLILFISTFYNSGDITSPIAPFYRVMAVCILISMSLRENPIMLLKVISRYLGIVLAVNIILLFIFEGHILPTGPDFQAQFFLGHRNAITQFSVFAILTTAAYSLVNGRFSATSILIISLTIITHFAFDYFITWSATGFLSTLIMIVSLLLVSFKRVRKFLSFPILFSINIFLFFFIVIFRLQENFGFIIQDFLGRAITFTGRTFLWDFALDMIAQAPILGHGFGEIRFDGFGTAHNLVLEILVRGGWLALLAYLVILIFAGMSLAKRKDHPISSIFSSGIFVVLVATLMESSFNSVIIFSIFSYSFHIDKLIAAQEAFHIEESETGCSANWESRKPRIQKSVK